MAYGEVVADVASAARTTSGNSGARSCEKALWLNLAYNVTAIGGTPSMLLTVEWSMDGTNFAPAETSDGFAGAVTATGAMVKQFAVKAPFYRVAWAITGGTPSLTFSVSRYTTGQ